MSNEKSPCKEAIRQASAKARETRGGLIKNALSQEFEEKLVVPDSIAVKRTTDGEDNVISIPFSQTLMDTSKDCSCIMRVIEYHKVGPSGGSVGPYDTKNLGRIDDTDCPVHGRRQDEG